MMDMILQKLYRWDSQAGIEDILKHYGYSGFAIVNFLYFANAMKYHLFEKTTKDIDVDYMRALLQSDFLFPDGIALQVWDKFVTKKSTHNLNGTDFTPLFLDYISKNYNVELYIVSVYDEKIWKWTEWLQKGIDAIKSTYWIEKIYAYQTQYAKRGEEFPFEQRASEPKDETTIRVMLHCTGTPFQELWTQKNKKRYQEKNMLVMNVGGFIDFVSWFEKRAPKRAVKARVLETPWRILSSPRKNIKKFLTMFWFVRVLRKNMIGKIKGFIHNLLSWKK